MDDKVDPVILGNRLRAAREAKGMTQQSAADAIGVIRTTLVAMEAGKRKPRESELFKLAELYGEDPHRLVLRIDPVTPETSLIGHFRRTARADTAADHKLQACVEEVQQIMQRYRELENIYGAAAVPIRAPDYQIPTERDQTDLSLGPSVTRIAEEVAAAERNRLGIGDAPIRDLFDVLEEEEEGINIFQMDLPPIVSAFYGSDDALGTCIVVNRNHDAGRRHRSLAHEYGHVLTRRQFPGFKILLTLPERRVPQSERFTDAFATALLLPAASVGRRLHRIKESQGEFQSGDIMRMAHAFRVSFEAMTLRLEDLELIPSGTFERLKALGYKPQEALASRNLEPFRISGRRLPLRYEFLVYMSFAKGLITENEVMQYLGADRISARKRMSELSLQPFISEAGNELTLEIPFVATRGA
jgi:Zn-dependent peptidase ImmA (M78 family)/DNA-binding XRE family transcriptional regulator